LAEQLWREMQLAIMSDQEVFRQMNLIWADGFARSLQQNIGERRKQQEFRQLGATDHSRVSRRRMDEGKAERIQANVSQRISKGENGAPFSTSAGK
jgi:hypothetical protein